MRNYNSLTLRVLAAGECNYVKKPPRKEKSKIKSKITKVMENSPVLCYSRRLHCRWSPRRTSGWTCSEVEAGPAEIGHLARGHCVSFGKAASVSAKMFAAIFKNQNTVTVTSWRREEQTHLLKRNKALPLPVSDTGVVDTSASSCCCLQTWVCLHRNHKCRSLSCRDRLYILHRPVASASYATE